MDEEKVVIVSNGQSQEFPWTAFIAFIHQETRYVFDAAQGINSLYWNKSEMGEEPCSGMLEMLKRKLYGRRFNQLQITGGFVQASATESL